VALATVAAMATARALGGARFVVVQAAGAAILTVVVENGERRINRLADALIGGLAPIFSQFLVFPEPPQSVCQVSQARPICSRNVPLS